MSRIAIFDNINLQAGVYGIHKFPFNTAVNKIMSHKLARADKEVVVRENLKGRDISLGGWISAPTQDEADNAYDALVARVGRQDLLLQLGYPEGLRQWDVKCLDVMPQREAWDVSTLYFKLVLFAPNPIGRNLTPRALIPAQTGLTSLASVLAHPVGSYGALPLITLTFNSVAPNNRPINIEIGESSQGNRLKLKRTLQDGDVIVIDSEARQTTHNGATIDIEGGFYPFFANAQDLLYNDDATSRNYDLSATFYPLWK